MTEQEKYRSFEDIKCLWMKCGAVDYKLCDKNFVCEDCDFDKEMLSNLRKRGGVNGKIENVLEIGQRTVSFTHPYYHCRNGLIVRNFISNNYYMGIEPYIVKLIDVHSTLKYCSSKNSIAKGEPILNLSNGWGEVKVISPFNFNFLEKLELSNIYSNDLRWFAVIEAERFEILDNSINKKSYYDKLYETKIYLMNLIKTSNGVGMTMYDGGTVLEDWPAVLGNNIYRNLLEKLFS